MSPPIVVGVLAIQGAFAKHIQLLTSLGVEAVEVRKPQDLEQCDALIIPGGESTAILRQLENFHFFPAFDAYVKEHPIFGTCAGMILMSKEVLADKIRPLGLIDITVERNAFGKQIESFRTDIDVQFTAKDHQWVSVLFIRAPRIRHTGSDVEILATLDNEPILVRQGNYLAASFHSELAGDPSIHKYFLKMIKANKK
jgi:pyridoxal 5'-phosphate synthase pdxT subunit